MTNIDTSSKERSNGFEADWPGAHGWAIEQMPCPAYCCNSEGAIVKCNASAKRLWGWRPSENKVGLWHGFDSLQTLDGKPVERSLSPAALAVSGANASEVELVAKCRDGETRRVVARAKAIIGSKGDTVGVVCCIIDITERCRWEMEAREVVEGRGDFLTVLAHELRNPLSPIMSATKILRRTHNDPVTSRIVETVERQARTLSRFVSDLLDASRSEHLWELRVEPRVCTVSDVLQRATDNAQTELRMRKQNLAIDVSDANAELLCDPKRIAQALGNVLVNASKFTPDEGEIRLSITIDENILRIEVLDQGQGIADEELDKLFTPFARHPTAPGRAPSGAGVGLAIAKSVCEAHSGTISGCNNEGRHGAVFSLQLPIVTMFK